MKHEQLQELLYQALETKIDGGQVLWDRHSMRGEPRLEKGKAEVLKQMRDHEHILRGLVETMGFDPAKETPGRLILRHKGKALVEAMNMALKTGKPEAAQLVASECVVTAKTKDHLRQLEPWVVDYSLGLPATLPPPEEERDVKSAGDAARAKKSRNEMLIKQPYVYTADMNLRGSLGAEPFTSIVPGFIAHKLGKVLGSHVHPEA